MLKPKDLAKMTDRELFSTYLDMCNILHCELEAFKYSPTFECEQSHFEDLKPWWADIKRCHKEVTKRGVFDGTFVWDSDR